MIRNRHNMYSTETCCEPEVHDKKHVELSTFLNFRK